jgi:hypothetical protein
MNFIRRAPEILLYVFLTSMLIGAISCASTKRNMRSTRPKKGKMKPCGCPTSRQYKSCYDATNQFC